MSDDFITIGGRRPTCTVRDNASTSIVISGSKRYPRDLGLRFGEAVEVVVLLEVRPLEKFCSGCGEWRLKSYFSPDTRNLDGLHSHCKACRNDHMRKMRLITSA